MIDNSWRCNIPAHCCQLASQTHSVVWNPSGCLWDFPSTKDEENLICTECTSCFLWSNSTECKSSSVNLVKFAWSKPSWLKAGLHSFSTSNFSRPAMKTCLCGQPARKTCQKSVHASNFHFHLYSTLLAPEGSTPQQGKLVTHPHKPVSPSQWTSSPCQEKLAHVDRASV